MEPTHLKGIERAETAHSLQEMERNRRATMETQTPELTKREIIDRITELNRSADPGFLAQFSADDLLEYLRHLDTVQPCFS